MFAIITKTEILKTGEKSYYSLLKYFFPGVLKVLQDPDMNTIIENNLLRILNNPNQLHHCSPPGRTIPTQGTTLAHSNQQQCN